MQKLVMAAISAFKAVDNSAIAYGRGLKAYFAGDYTTSMNELRPLAERGYARAQAKVGGMYNLGHGVPQNLEEAERWYRLAAEQGNADAQCWMGQYFDQEIFLQYSGVEWLGEREHRDNMIAEPWYRRAAEQGHAWAQFRIGQMHYAGCDNGAEMVVERDDREAERWFRLAAKQGNAEAQYRLSDIELHTSKQLHWCRLAANQGYGPAQHQLGMWYSNDIPWHVEPDPVEAARWFRLAAENGYNED
jgi:hypothetical protein